MSERPTPEAYHAFVAELELRGVRLISSEVRTSGFPPIGSEIAVDYAQDVRVEPFDGGFEMVFAAEFTFRPPADETAPDSSGRVAAAFGLLYTGTTEPEGDVEGYYDVFKEVSLPVNAWPYVREFVQSTMMRMGWPPLTLPLLKPFGGQTDASEDEEEGGGSETNEAGSND